MAFDPDKYLAEPEPSTGFDPDAYLSKKAAPATKAEPSQFEQVGEFFKGATLPVAGIAQSIPYEPIQRKAAEYVKGVEAKPEYIAPGGTIGARTLGKGIGSLGLGTVPLGKAFDITAALPAIPKILSRTLAGTAGGALAGSVMEEAPTVEEIGPRKLAAAKTGAITGAVVTPALSGIGSLSKGAYDLVMKAKGKSVQEAIDALKNFVTKEAEEARNFLKQKSYEAEKVAKSEVATAKDITETRYATRSKLTKDLDNAKKETDTSLKDLSNNRQSDENLGKFIQNSGKKNIEAIRATTTKEAIRDIKDPAFERARGRATSGDTLSTNPDSAPILKEIVSDIEQQIADVPGRFRGELEGRIDDIIGKKTPLSSNELRVEQLRESSIPGYIAQKFKREPLTLHQAEFLRRWAKDPILRKDTGFGSLDATRMAGTGNRIEQAMTAYEPDVGRYIQTYKTGKEAERVAAGGRRGEGLTEQVAKTEDEILFSNKPQQVTSYYLDGTRESANKLIRLVGGKTPELVNRVKSNVREKIEGMTAEKTAEFAAKNQGLFQAFPEVGQAVNKVVQSRQAQQRLESMLGKAAGKGGRLEQALGTEITSAEKLSKQVESGKKATAPYQQFLEKFEGAKGEEVFTESKKIVDKLRQDGIVEPAKYQEMLSQIRDIEQKYGASDEAKKRVKTVLYVGLVGFGGYKAYRGATDYLGLGQ
jgi:hypothetical protein